MICSILKHPCTSTSLPVLLCASVGSFTRPRRFGKSLNMNMLKYFFEYGCDPQLFEGLAISAEPQLCQEHMGKYPVISITLKDVSGNGYTTALEMLRSVIGREAMRFQFLLDSEALTAWEGSGSPSRHSSRNAALCPTAHRIHQSKELPFAHNAYGGARRKDSSAPTSFI